MLRLLIVDDEPTIRRGIRESIDWESRGVRVVGEAGNGQEARQQVRALAPDVALVDIVMPRGDGLAFCEWCRKEAPLVRLIIVSGHDEFAFAQRALRRSDGKAGRELTVRAKAFAHAVHFGLRGDGEASDEYFDLLPGESRRIIVRGRTAAGPVPAGSVIPAPF